MNDRRGDDDSGPAPDGEENAPVESPQAEPDADDPELYFPKLETAPGPPDEPAAAEPIPVQVAPPRGWPLAATPMPIGAPPVPPPEPPVDPPRLEPPPPLRPLVKRRRPIAVRIALFAVKAVLAFVIVSFLWVALYCFVPPPVTLTMLGDAIGGHGITKTWRSLESIDPDMARAAIAAEDGNFCSHSGFDWKAIEAAYKRNATGKKRIRGGSTISQQTAKNVFLWQGGGYLRKGLEAWFTMLIEAVWGKRRIMEVYLNVAETGIGTYGVEEGAKRYFHHSAAQLSPQEAAKIAAVLPLPKRRAGTDPRGFTRRYGNTIAARMAQVKAGALDSCLR